jgi:L-fuculose-phosphate aldolase
MHQKEAESKGASLLVYQMCGEKEQGMAGEKLWGSPEDEAGIGESEARELICEIGRRLWLKDMADCNAGNISYRLGPDRVLATPTLISKGFMKPDDLVVLDMAGNQISGTRQKTSETRMHLGVYAERPDAKAVIHAHPRHVLSFAITNTTPESCILTEVEGTIGEIPMVPYQTQGTADFAAALRPFVKDHMAFILAQHGALTLGRGLIEAFWAMETLETYCAVLLTARILGEPKRIPSDKMAEIYALKKRLGIPDKRA